MTSASQQRYDQDEAGLTDAHLPEVVWLSDEEWLEQFDTVVRERMGISGDEFIDRWNAGEFYEIADTAGHRHIMELGMLIPYDRRQR